MQLYNVALKASAYNSLNFDLGIDVCVYLSRYNVLKKISYTAGEYSHFYSAPCRIEEVHLSIYHFLFYLLRRLLFCRVINLYFKEIRKASFSRFVFTDNTASYYFSYTQFHDMEYKFIRVIRRKMKINFDEV